jgi:hypothetical protein
MRKTILGIMTFFVVSAGRAQSNIFEANGNVGIDIPSPNTKLHVLDPTESRPGGISAPTKASFKLSRAGTFNYSYVESAEFRLGHGGPSVWGSQLDLYINGAGNNNNIPDQHAMTWQYNGNVGIGTTNPRGLLDIGRHIDNGAIGAVLARLPEGDTQGEGTFLGVKAWETKLPGHGANYNGKSFSIEHSFYGALNSAINFYRGQSLYGGFITFSTYNGTEQMRISETGNVGIGLTAPNEKLTVNGKIRAKEIKVETGGVWADYVFEPTYKLMSLKETEAFIKKNKHLPNIPSAREVEENGVELGNNQALLLAKIEELTLHIIELEKRITLQERKSAKR